MAMFKPSQSYSGGVIVDPYTGNIAQDLQFLSGEDRKKKKPTPFLDWVAHGNPVTSCGYRVFLLLVGENELVNGSKELFRFLLEAEAKGTLSFLGWQKYIRFLTFLGLTKGSICIFQTRTY